MQSVVDEEYDSVVVGLAPSLFNYDHLNIAFRTLMSKPPKPFIATHRARYIRVSSDSSESSNTQNTDNTLSLGPGPFVAALETAAGVQAQVVGKPSRAFFESVISSLPDSSSVNEESKTAIIGDDVETDLGGGAVELGLWRVLGEFLLACVMSSCEADFTAVKTGKYRPGDENRSGAVPPDEVHETFAAFVESLLGANDG